MSAPPLMTVEDYFKTPETMKPMELIFGVLRVADSPTARHQSAVASFFLALNAHVRARQLGKVWLSPLDVVFDERKALILQPDLMFISSNREWVIQDKVRGVPDLVLEVLSPNPRIGRTEERVGWFREYGVLECWLVHQDRRDVTVLDFTDNKQHVYTGREPIRSCVLADFAESLDDVLLRAG